MPKQHRTMKSQPQSAMSLDSVDDSTPSLDKMSKATSDSSTATLSLNSSSSTFSSCEEDDLLKFEKAGFAPSEQGAKKSNQMMADPSDTPLQSPRRSLHMISPRKTPRRRASACDSVAMSHSSLSTARTNNTSASTRRQASRHANVKNQSSAAMPITSFPLAADFTDQRDMVRPPSDPRSLRRRHSMESAILERRSSGTGIAPVISPRKDSYLTNTPGTQKKRALNRRKERHDQVLSKSLTMFIGERIMNASSAGRRGGADNVQRSAVKALVWRAFAIINTLTMATFVTHDMAVASKIASLDAVFKTALMFQYERIAARIPWGKVYSLEEPRVKREKSIKTVESLRSVSFLYQTFGNLQATRLYRLLFPKQQQEGFVIYGANATALDVSGGMAI